MIESYCSRVTTFHVRKADPICFLCDLGNLDPPENRKKTATSPPWASNIFTLFKHCLSTETTLRQHWVKTGRIMQQFASFICIPRYLRFSADCIFFGLTRFRRRLKHHSFTLRTPWLNISKRLLKLFKTLFSRKIVCKYLEFWGIILIL